MQKNTEQNHSGIFEPLYVFREPGIRCASFCGDGRLLALGASQEVLIYELASGKITKRIGIRQKPEAVFVTRQGKLAVCGVPVSDEQERDPVSYISLYDPQEPAKPLPLHCSHASRDGSLESVYAFTEGRDGTLSGFCEWSEPEDWDSDGSVFYRNYDCRVTWDTANGSILLAAEMQKYASVAAASGDDNLLLLLGPEESRLFRVHSKMIRPGYRICKSDMKMSPAYETFWSLRCESPSGMFCVGGYGHSLRDAELIALRDDGAEGGARQNVGLPVPVGGRIVWDHDKDYDPGYDEHFVTMYEDAFGEQFRPDPLIPVLSLYFAHERTPCCTLFLPEIYPIEYSEKMFAGAQFAADEESFTVVTKAATYTFELSSGRCLEMRAKDEC